MKIRLIGKTELIKNIINTFGLSVKIYPSRNNPQESRIYLDIEDDFVKQGMAKITKAISGKD